MGPGGAERVVSRLSRYWTDSGRAIVVVTLSGEPSFYPLDEGVQHIALDLLSPSANRITGAVNSIGRARAMRKTIRSLAPDVVISFMDKTNVLVLLATRGLNIPVIVSERTFPGSYSPGAEWEALRRITYRFASRVIAVTEDMRRALDRRGIRNIDVIPNPVAPRRAGDPPSSFEHVGDGVKLVMAAGRLEHLKGFDILIESFSSVNEAHPDWELVIAGAGDLRESLMDRARRRGVGERVHFPGIVRDLPGQLSGAEIFVLSSRFEGFPNVLVEAMAAGAAVVATECPSGPAEIIRDGDNGLLVPVGDAGALASALDRLMSDAALRQRLGDSATSVTETYSVEGVMRRWDHVVAEAIAA